MSGSDLTARSDSGAPGPRPQRGMRWLPTRIRTKLILLHTGFSLALAVALLLALQQPISDMMYEAEAMEAKLALELAERDTERLDALGISEITISRGTAERFGLDPTQAELARSNPGTLILRHGLTGPMVAARWLPGEELFLAAEVRLVEARAAINRLYALVTLALLAVYGLIALTLEAFVLPRQVYRPIEVLRAADEAVQTGRRSEEIIPDALIPADEIGEIMRSRNESISKLRSQELQIEQALHELETAAGELKRKNHLLETAKQNIADQDRLASLGMMSAGIAHELNTPLAVLKGCVEELVESEGHSVSAERAALMLRVVNRLEALSESLLGFARVRPPAMKDVRLAEVAEEAWTLVALDRNAAGIEMRMAVDSARRVVGDPDRLTQVLVNILRNAVDALEGRGLITVTDELTHREGRGWVSILVADTGPGIDPAVLPRLFEPFQSTRLDARGTGLGLAVADGIVREHGGVLLARNAVPPSTGAIFEIMLPSAERFQGLVGLDADTLPRAARAPGM